MVNNYSLQILALALILNMIAFSVVHRVYSKLLPSHCLCQPLSVRFTPFIMVCLLPLPPWWSVSSHSLHHCLSPPTPSPSWSFSSHSLHHRLSPPTPSIILCPLSMPLSSPSEIKFGVDQPDGHDDLHYIYSLKDFQAFTSSTYEGMFDRAIRTVQVYVGACE